MLMFLKIWSLNIVIFKESKVFKFAIGTIMRIIEINFNRSNPREGRLTSTPGLVDEKNGRGYARLIDEEKYAISGRLE